MYLLVLSVGTYVRPGYYTLHTYIHVCTSRLNRSLVGLAELYVPTEYLIAWCSLKTVLGNSREEAERQSRRQSRAAVRALLR